MKFADFTDCVSACAGDHDISHGKQIRKLVLDIFILDVSGSTVERFIGFSLSAEMNNLEFLQKFREDLADIIIDRSSSQTTTDNHKYRFVSSETTEFTTVFRISGKKFLADRSSCKNCFVSWKIGDCLRKITADSGCRRETEFIGKTWSHVGLVDQCGDF